MLVVPEQTYPLICVAVSKGTELNQVVRFGTVNPNSTSSWFTEAGENTARLCQVKPITVFFGGNSTGAKVILCLFSSSAETPQTCVIHVTQLERDTILVCLDSESLIDFYSSYPFTLCSWIFSGSDLEVIYTYFICFTKLFPLSFLFFLLQGV